MYHKKAFRTVRTTGKKKKSADPYTYYFPNPEKCEHYVQYPLTFASMDPATKTHATRIETHYSESEVSPLLFCLENFTAPTGEKKKGHTTFSQINVFLESIFPELSRCHYILIEKQPVINQKTVRISQHIISYCMLKFKDSENPPIIVECDCRHIREILGIEKEDKKKSGVVSRAKEILKTRGDSWSLQILESKKKQDDLADTVCQIEGYLKDMRS